MRSCGLGIPKLYMALNHSRRLVDQTLKVVSERFKATTNFQTGTCSAILAAIALEKGQVIFGHLPSVTAIRSGLGGVNILAFWWMKIASLKSNNDNLWRIVMAAYVTIQSLILIFSQAITIILISDITLKSVHSFSSSSNVTFGFTNEMLDKNSSTPQTASINRPSTWLRKPEVYPIFAEYSELPFHQEGVSDRYRCDFENPLAILCSTNTSEHSLISRPNHSS